jgi:hypothetical protein
MRTAAGQPNPRREDRVLQYAEWMSVATIWGMAVWGVLWLLVFFVLRIGSGRIARRLRDRLRTLVGGFSRKPDYDSDRHITDEIAVFLQAIEEAVSDPARVADRQMLRSWITDRDADKLELKRHRFEWWFNFARAQIEVLPLAGICGTLLRMVMALGGPAVNPMGGTEQTVSEERILGLTTQFAYSLLSTLVALVAAIILMWANAWVEPGFARLIELRAEYRRVVEAARRELIRAEERP